MSKKNQKGQDWISLPHPYYYFYGIGDPPVADC